MFSVCPRCICCSSNVSIRVMPQLLLDPTFRINIFAAAAMASTAVAHQSQLAGFLAVAGLFAALGFAGESAGYCLVVK